MRSYRQDSCPSTRIQMGRPFDKIRLTTSLDSLPHPPKIMRLTTRNLVQLYRSTFHQLPVSSRPVPSTAPTRTNGQAGSQFCINYVVKEEPCPPCHLFFKLYMNGRHITSWGINPRIKTAGRAEKALYEPSQRWNQEENGVVFKQEGIEARYFHFVSSQPEQSVAEDGGVIEVQVFRAKGRKRRAAKLDQYRHQEKYGIT